MGDAPTRTERGFARYQLLDTDHGHTIKVFESSSATAPCLWLQVDAESSRSGESGSLTAHLRPEQVDGLIDRLIAARDGHYQREGERGGGNQADDGSAEGRGEDASPAEPNDSSASAPTAPADPRGGTPIPAASDEGDGRTGEPRTWLLGADEIDPRIINVIAGPNIEPGARVRVGDLTTAPIDIDVLKAAPPEWKRVVGAAWNASTSPDMTLGEADAMLRAALPHLRAAAPDETGDGERTVTAEPGDLRHAAAVIRARADANMRGCYTDQLRRLADRLEAACARADETGAKVQPSAASLDRAQTLSAHVRGAELPWSGVPVEHVAYVYDMLDAAGAEVAPVGTLRALEFAATRCPDCYGQGYHQDDSHPGTESRDCDRCGGTGHVPRTAPSPGETTSKEER